MVYDADGAAVTSFLAYEPTFTGGVRVAVADLDGDGGFEVVTGAGPGGGPRVRVFDGATGAAEADFFAYEQTFTGGIFVAAGPVGDGQVGIATGADAGGGPRVKVFEADGTTLQDFFAFDEAYTGGVRVALGDPGDGPKVYAVNGAGMAPTLRAFDAATTGLVFEVAAGDENSTGGVLLASGDVSGDGADDVITVVPNGTDAEVWLFNGATGSWANATTIPAPVDGVGVVVWDDEPAVGVLSGGTLTAYAFSETFGDPPTVLGTESSAGGAGSSLGSHDLYTPPVLYPVEIDRYSGLWVGGGAVGLLEVVTQVSEDEYQWSLTFMNQTYPAEPGAPDGVWRVWMTVPEGVPEEEFLRFETPPGWTVSYDEATGLLQWLTSNDNILSGQSRTFVFYTAPRPVVLSPGWAQGFAGDGFFTAQGDGKLPGPLPRIIITDRNGVEVGPNGLKVAKWWYAFAPTGPEGKAELRAADAKSDFLDFNDDRFYVWVRDPVNWSNAVPLIKAKIGSRNLPGNGRWNDGATEIPLVRVASEGGSKAGWYVSDSQFAVSNMADDKHSDSRVGPDDVHVSLVENAPQYTKNGRTFPVSDRTHRIALGGSFIAEYDTGYPGIGAFGVISASAVVPVEKVVKINVAVLGVTSKTGVTTPSHSKADVDEDIAVARESYAQVGIRIDVVGINYTAAQPVGVNLSDGLQGGGHDGNLPTPLLVPTTEQQALFDADELWADPPEGVVHVYYVNSLEPDDDFKGQAFPISALGKGYEFYDGSVLIGDNNTRNGLDQINGRKRMILAHEIFHVLESRPPYDANNVNADHFPYGGPGGYTDVFNVINLMWHGRGGSFTYSIWDQVRLTNEQHCYVICARPDLLSSP